MPRKPALFFWLLVVIGIVVGCARRPETFEPCEPEGPECHGSERCLSVDFPCTPDPGTSICTEECTSDLQCPLGFTGSGGGRIGICFEGRCFARCDVDTDCPDGFSCVDTFPGCVASFTPSGTICFPTPATP